MTTTVWRGLAPVRATGSRPAPGVDGRARETSTHGGPARGPGPLGDGLLVVLVVVARVYRALLLTLLTVAMLPTLGSWSGYLVRTGSMEPAIRAGDVVIGQPFSREDKVPVGRVMIFEAPPGSGAGSVLRVHRVVERLADGAFVTAGDANPTPDAAHVSKEYFRSRAIIEVPYVGLPMLWLEAGQYLRVAAWLLGTGLLLLYSFRRVGGDRPRGRGLDAPHRIGARVGIRSRRHRGAGSVVRVALALSSAVLLVGVPTAADAAFTATTRSGSNTWKAAALLRQPYTSAVMADTPYAFYRLDEASGLSAADYAGSNRTGSYTAVAAYRETGALPANPGYAVRLAAGTGRMVGGGTNGLSNPTTFSVELWVKTTTTAGGKLIGFESSRNQDSTTADRVLVMRTDGRLAFMGGTGLFASTLATGSALNNGVWHHLVVTAKAGTFGGSDVVLYVDGARATSGNVTSPTSYVGWWRVGYGKVPTGTYFPSSGNFTGSVDDVAIYTTQLSATRVTAHYAAR